MTLGAGGGVYLFGVLLPEVLHAFPWTRAEIAGANSVSMLMMGGLSPVVGRWVDRRDAGPIMALGALVCGGGFAAQALVGRIAAVNAVLPTLAQFYACQLAYGAGLAAIGFTPVNTVVARWFSERRGMALGIVAAGVGLGGFLTVPEGWALDAWGWRVASIVTGGVIALVIAPLAWTTMRVPTGPSGATNAPGSGGRGDEARAAALASRPFWALALAFSVFTLIVQVVRVHGIALLQDAGSSAADARMVVTGLAVAGVVGKLVFGYLGDRLPPRPLAAASYALLATGLLALLSPTARGATWAFVLAFGLPMGGIATLEPLLVAKYFGAQAFGAVYGTLLLFLTVGAAAGPVLAGYAYDVAGGYGGALWGCVAAAVVSGALAVSAGPPAAASLPRSRPDSPRTTGRPARRPPDAEGTAARDIPGTPPS